MTKIITAFLGYLFFLWFLLSGATAQEQNDRLQPEIDVEIEMNFLKSRIWSRTLLKRKMLEDRQSAGIGW